MKTRKVHVDGVNIVLEKNGGYMLSSLGGRLISMGRQAGSGTKIFTIDNFNLMNSKA